MRATVGRWRCAPRCVVGEPREEWGGREVGGLAAPPPSQLKTTARRLVKWLALHNAVSPFLILLLSIRANGVDTSHRTKALHMADAYTHSHTHADTHTPTPRCTHTRTHTHADTDADTDASTLGPSPHTPSIKNAGPRYNVSECIPSSPPSSAHPTPFLLLL